MQRQSSNSIGVNKPRTAAERRMSMVLPAPVNAPSATPTSPLPSPIVRTRIVIAGGGGGSARGSSAGGNTAASSSAATAAAVVAATAALEAATVAADQRRADEDAALQLTPQRDSAAAQPQGRDRATAVTSNRSDDAGSVSSRGFGAGGIAPWKPAPSKTAGGGTAAASASSAPHSASAAGLHQVVLRRRYHGSTQLTRHTSYDGKISDDSDDPSSASSKQQQQPQSLVISSQRTVDTAFSLISRSPLFTSLRDQRVLMRIAESVTWASAEAGQYIVVAGEKATEMYFLFSGVVEVLVPVSEEEEMLVVTLNGGEFFGEIALVSKEQTLRSASVQAVRPCELLVLSRMALEAYIAESDELRECLELEAAKRLQGLKERESKLLANESDVDRELLERARHNNLSPIECEWRLLNKSRIPGVNRTQPPSTFADALGWARLHMQRTPAHFHGRTTSALATLPMDLLLSASIPSGDPAEASSSFRLPHPPPAGGGGGSDGGLLLIHPEMGCVYKYSVVIDALAGPDEFHHLCSSLARCLQHNLKLGLQKQSLGALALAAHVALFFSHSRKAERDRFLTMFANRLVTVRAQAAEERESSSARRRSSPPNRTSEMTVRGHNVQFGLRSLDDQRCTTASSTSDLATPLIKTATPFATPGRPNSPSSRAAISELESGANSNQVTETESAATIVVSGGNSITAGNSSTYAIFDNSPFVWDSTLLESMTAQLSAAPSWEVSSTILFDLYPKQFVLSDAWALATLERLVAIREEMIRRVCLTAIEQMIERRDIVRRYAADRGALDAVFVQRRQVIRKAQQMLMQIECSHRTKLAQNQQLAAAAISRWHETRMSFAASVRTQQESLLAGALGAASSAALYHHHPHHHHHQLAGRGGDKREFDDGKLSVFLRSGVSATGSTGRQRALSAGASFSGRRGTSAAAIASLVAQRERMADDALRFKQRVQELRRA